MRRFFALFFSLVFLIGMVPGILHAQASPNLSLDIVPLNPQPGDTVTVTATSYSADLSQSTLSWNYNGRLIASGIGKTSVTVIAPTAGTSGTVSVTVTGNGASDSAASITLHPGSIDLLWEAADSYTPPFYKGKALLPVGGLIRVTAIPSATAPKNLSFDWSENGEADQALSGYGKSSIVVAQSALTSQEKIDITAHSGAFSGTDSISLVPHDAAVVVYQNKEGFIDYANGSNDTLSINTPGVVLHFEPYYFSVPDTIANDLTIGMTIDGTAVSPQQENEIGLSRPTNGGRSVVSLAITTAAYSLQHLTKAFTLLFN